MMMPILVPNNVLIFRSLCYQSEVLETYSDVIELKLYNITMKSH